MATRKRLRLPNPTSTYHMTRARRGDALKLSLGVECVTLRGAGKFAHAFLKGVFSAAVVGRELPSILDQEVSWHEANRGTSGKSPEYEDGYIAAFRALKEVHALALQKAAATICEEVEVMA